MSIDLKANRASEKNKQPSRDSFVDFKPIKPKKHNFIFAILKEAKDDSDNPVKFLLNLYSILCSSLFVIIMMTLSLCLPIIMLVIGIIYRNDCVIDANIPIWLIVSGCTGILNISIRIIASVYLHKKNKKTRSHSVDPYYVTYVTFILGLFQLIWFLIGNAWVYSVSSRISFKNNESNYCSEVCYLFAFWSIIFCWIISGLFLLFLIGLVLFFVISLICQKYSERDKLKNIRNIR